MLPVDPGLTSQIKSGVGGGAPRRALTDVGRLVTPNESTNEGGRVSTGSIVLIALVVIGGPLLVWFAIRMFVGARQERRRLADACAQAEQLTHRHGSRR